MSGWEMKVKQKWLGNSCHLQGPAGNDIQKTNVPNIRLAYRYQTLMEERFMVLGSLPLDTEMSRVSSESLTQSESIVPTPVPAVKVLANSESAGYMIPPLIQSAPEPLLSKSNSPVLKPTHHPIPEYGTAESSVMGSPKLLFSSSDVNAPLLALNAPALPLIPNEMAHFGTGAACLVLEKKERKKSLFPPEKRNSDSSFNN